MRKNTTFINRAQMTLPAMNSTLEYDFIQDENNRNNYFLKLINRTNSAMVIENISFVTNAKIDYPSGMLAQQWSNVKKTQDGDFYTYSLKLNPPITLQPGVNDALQYQTTEALGLLQNIAMPVQQVCAQIAGQNPQLIPLTNPNPQSNPHPNFELDMYHANWGQYAYKQTINTEDFADINCISYAFLGFNEQGDISSLDAWGDQRELPLLALTKQRKPYLKTSIAFGGWTNAGARMDTVFSAMAANLEARAKFVKNAQRAIVQTGATDINIDWEYAETEEDAKNFLALLQELHTAMPHVTLSIAAPAGSDKIKVFTAEEWQQIANLTARISIMTYDYFGAFSDQSDFHAAWKLSSNSPHSQGEESDYCVAGTLALYEKMGVPKKKLALGIPNYARSMIVANPGQFAGLYQPIVGTPPGDFSGCDGIYGWNSIQKLLNKQPSSLDQLGVKKWYYYDSTHDLCRDANMSLLSGELPNGQWVVMNFVDPVAATWRAQQAVKQGMGGAMLWANYTESTNRENSIVRAVSNGLNTQAQNLAKKAVQTRAAYSKEAFFASDKHAVLNRLQHVNDALTIRTMIATHHKQLATHRNIFKWLLISLVSIVSEQTAQSLFDKPKSLQLAEQMLAAFEPIMPTPSRLIERAAPLQQPPIVVVVKPSAAEGIKQLGMIGSKASTAPVQEIPTCNPPAYNPGAA